MEKKIWKKLGKSLAINYPQLHPNITCSGKLDTFVVTGFLGLDSWRVIVTKSFISQTRHFSITHYVQTIIYEIVYLNHKNLVYFTTIKELN